MVCSHTPHCPRKHCCKLYLVSSPIHHSLVNPDVTGTWWDEEKAEKQIKQGEGRKKDDGERVVILIMLIIDDLHNYSHVQRTSTYMVSFIH